MKKFLILIYFLLSQISFATEQRAERLLLNGENYAMCAYQTFPMEDYLKANNVKTNFKPTSTANWRGYIGEYIVRDNKLFFIGAYKAKAQNVKEKEEIYPVSAFTKNEDDNELFCEHYTSKFPIRLSTKSNIWQAGLLEEENLTMEVLNGIVTITKDTIPLKNMSIKDFKRLKDYDPAKDNLDSWYDLSLLTTEWGSSVKIDEELSKRPVYSASRSINKEEFKEIKEAKSIKTRGLVSSVYCREKVGGFAINLALPMTRKYHTIDIDIDTDTQLNEFKDKFVEVEITNPLISLSIKLLSIRELSPQESIHNAKLEDREFRTWQNHLGFREELGATLIINRISIPKTF